LTLVALAQPALALEPPTDKGIEKPAASGQRLSGPYTHENLTIYLIHGADVARGKKFLTLDEALKQKKVVVNETSTVNQLTIENSSDEAVFIQAGDIVKGGQQDRTLANDLVVPPRSGKLPVASFCVEQGRWSARGAESDKQFSRSAYQLADNHSKLACRADGSQQRVWANVARVQKDLASNLKAEVRSADSSSSLQLTLEHKKVLEAIDTAIKKLEKAPGKESDVIGYAVVINGKVNNADIYGNADLFRQLWPKLLMASAIEAVATRKEGAKIENVKPEAVTAFLGDAEKGKRTEKKVGKDLEVKVENEKNVLFDTRADGGKGPSLRRSYLAR